MSWQKHLVSFVALACVARGAVAQEVEFTGVIQPATLASFCQEETHFLTCGSTPFTGELLKSSTLDLDAFVGRNTKFSAVLRGVECDIWDVTSAASPTATLTYCGSPVPGCPMRFRVGPTGVIGRFWLLWSLSADFRSPPNGIEGTLLLGSPFFVLGSGPTFGPGSAVEFDIPPDPALTGLRVWLQGARQDVGPIGPIEMTNAVCFTILSPTVPCVSPDC